MSSNALVKLSRTGTNLTVQQMTEVAEFLRTSGFFPGKITGPQALSIIQTGQELGIPPAAALKGIFLIEGKPALSATLMAAVVKRSGKYDFELTETTPKRAAMTFYEEGRKPKTIEYTAEEAKLAGHYDGKNGHSWKKYPTEMLVSKLFSRMQRWYAPDTVLGPIYSPVELDEPVDDEGRPVEVEVVEVRQDGLQDDQYQALMDKIEEVGADQEAIKKHLRVSDLRNLKPKAYEKAMALLSVKGK